MKTIMANYFPMLSSSPPPIDDADSPEKDDEDDDFGIFTTASSAYDHGFDSPVFEKGVKSRNKFQPIKTSADDSPEKLSSTRHPFLENNVALEAKFYPLSPPKDDEGLANKSIGDNASENSVAETAVKLSGSGAFLPSVCSNSNSPCGELEDSNDSHKNKESVTSYSSHETPLDLSIIATSDIDSLEHAKENGCPVSDSNDRNDIVCDVPHCAELSDPDDRNITTVVSVNSKDFEHSVLKKSSGLDFVDSVDTSSHSNLPEAEPAGIEDLPKTWNPTIIEASKLDPASLSASDVPDLTFIPFPNEESGEDIDDFDEFQDFDYNRDSSYNALGENESKGSAEFCKSTEESEGDDDDFGNFEGVASSAGLESEETNVVDVKGGGDMNDFANFESTTFQATDYRTAEDSLKTDEFADFEGASFEAQLKIPISSTKEPEKGVGKLSTVINAVFELPESSEASSRSEKINEVLDQNCKSRRLWERLHDTDQTPGLPFQWSVSHSFQQMLHSVNIDYHSILRTSTVPFFASGLGLLEPTKGTASVTESAKIEEESSSSKDPIPPVEFDWGSSGLVNPLDSGQAISTLMDLSFLNSSSSVPRKDSSKSLSFEEELLATNLTTECNDSGKKAPILEQILSLGAKSSVVESYPGSRPPNLSQEAVHVLDQLPNISFMRAQVLMFPVSSST